MSYTEDYYKGLLAVLRSNLQAAKNRLANVEREIHDVHMQQEKLRNNPPSKGNG